MSSLREVEENLPAGFRFHPTDDELVCDYLLRWVQFLHNTSPQPGMIHHRHRHYNPNLLIQVDLNRCEPWDLPEGARVGDKEWYFYSQRDRKYSTGMRTNRATISGYWKATGKDRPVFRQACLGGMRKTLVFYTGRAPEGRKTDWVMHEFRLQGPVSGAGNGGSIPPELEDWVLCRVLYKKTPSSPELSATGGLMEAAFGAANQDPNYSHVPCFSIFRQNQTNPNLVDHMNTSSGLERLLPGGLSATAATEFGVYNLNLSSSSPSSSNNCYYYFDDEKEMMMRLATWNSRLMTLSKVDSDSNNNNGELMMKGFLGLGV